MKTQSVTPSLSEATLTPSPAIAGPIAEALHGIPNELIEQTKNLYFTDAPDILEVIEEMYQFLD